jgi:cohesin loading factor subunit SCC2
LDDVKTNNQADSNAAKTLALDHLGVIAARIRSSALKVEQAKDRDEFHAGALKSVDEARLFSPCDQTSSDPVHKLLTSANVKDLDALLAAHHDLRFHLCKRSSEDQAYEVSPPVFPCHE